MPEKANHPVRTTAKSLALIEQLNESNGARIHELEDRLEMTKGAIHNHLSTLREHGYVVKQGKEYQLSHRFLTLGGSVRSQNPLYQFGRSKINQLASQTGMLANLMTEHSGQGVYLYQSQGDYAVNLDTHVGYRIRLHYIGIGKAILAYLSRNRVNEIIDQWGLPRATENTITDKEALFEELATIQDRGFATDLEERTEGLACIAAPVRPHNEVLGAVSISGPTSRLGSDGFDEELISEVKSTANELSLDIIYR